MKHTSDNTEFYGPHSSGNVNRREHLKISPACNCGLILKRMLEMYVEKLLIELKWLRIAANGAFFD
jgi:hypothetical protein